MASTRSQHAVLLEGPAPPKLRYVPSARSNSWEDVADLAASLGVPLDDWQESALEASMGERTDGRWASKFIGMSAPRQNGKSQLIVARALAGVLLFGEKLIIVSAHETDTAREVWNRIIDVIESNPTLEARVSARMNAVNRESLTFGYGLDKQVVKLKARSQSGSRGFSADCLLLDEAQILGKQAWGSIVPTMSARPNPQAWLFGTPPTETDDPFAFARVRDSAMKGRARHCWLEWCADPEDDYDDPETWVKANPSYGVRVSHEACADDRGALDDEQFARERLGMWSVDVARRVIDADSWAIVADAASVAVDGFALAVDVAPDRSVASVALAGVRSDGLWHVELDEHRVGVGWVVPWVKSRCENNTIRAVVVDERSPAASLLDEFDKVKIKVTTTSARDMAKACGQFYDGVMDARLKHTDQPQVNVALSVAGKRPLGDAWAWNRRNSNADITPLVAETLALWGAQAPKVKRPATTGQGRRATVL